MLSGDSRSFVGVMISQLWVDSHAGSHGYTLRKEQMKRCDQVK